MRARDAFSSARLSVFAIAVATSSVNPLSLSSLPGGGGSSPVDATAITPQSLPSTVIGTATTERTSKPGPHIPPPLSCS